MRGGEKRFVRGGVPFQQAAHFQSWRGPVGSEVGGEEVGARAGGGRSATLTKGEERGCMGSLEGGGGYRGGATGEKPIPHLVKPWRWVGGGGR